MSSRPETDPRNLVSRRTVLRAGASLASVAAFTAIAACSDETAELKSQADPSTGPDMDKARTEGLVLWHCNQEPDVNEFLRRFTNKTGIPASARRILPGTGLPKLDQEYKANRPPSADVYDISDVGLMDQLRTQGRLQEYHSPEQAAYTGSFISNPKGFWTTYFINIQPITFRTDRIAPADQPKTYEDLLNPKWKGKICFQDASSGSAYNWWYQLRSIVSVDYFDRLAEQLPVGYESSTQMLQDLNSGQVLIAGFMSNYQYPGAIASGIPLKMVYPTIGTPTLNNAAGILANTPHPNAAKAYIDYLISKEGQEEWADCSNSISSRSDVAVPKGLPTVNSLKLLVAGEDGLDTFASVDTHAEFVKVWNKVLGVS